MHVNQRSIGMKSASLLFICVSISVPVAAQNVLPLVGRYKALSSATENLVRDLSSAENLERQKDSLSEKIASLENANQRLTQSVEGYSPRSAES
jgi:hypothetical protein